MKFTDHLAEEIERQTGEKPFWFSSPKGPIPEPRSTHLERAKKLTELINRYRRVDPKFSSAVKLDI